MLKWFKNYIKRQKKLKERAKKLNSKPEIRYKKSTTTINNYSSDDDSSNWLATWLTLSSFDSVNNSNKINDSGD